MEITEDAGLAPADITPAQIDDAPPPDAAPTPPPATNLFDEMPDDDADSAELGKSGPANLGDEDEAEPDAAPQPRSLAPPDDPSELAAWREEMGVPPDATGYAVPTVENFEWTDKDKPLLADFLGKVHGANAPQAVVDQALGWYANLIKEHQANVHNADRSDKAQVASALREVWGDAYEPNLRAVKRVLSDEIVMSRDLGQTLKGARTSDGRLLVNQPEFIELLSGLAASRSGQEAGRPARIAQLERLMKTDVRKYYEKGRDGKSPADELLALKGQRRPASSSPAHDVPPRASSREQDILRVLQTDADRYWAEGLDRELAAIRRARA